MDEFEYDETKALRAAFKKAIEQNKLFNVNRWKLQRERSRPKK